MMYFFKIVIQSKQFVNAISWKIAFKCFCSYCSDKKNCALFIFPKQKNWVTHLQLP